MIPDPAMRVIGYAPQPLKFKAHAGFVFVLDNDLRRVVVYGVEDAAAIDSLLEIKRPDPGFHYLTWIGVAKGVERNWLLYYELEVTDFLQRFQIVASEAGHTITFGRVRVTSGTYYYPPEPTGSKWRAAVFVPMEAS